MSKFFMSADELKRLLAKPNNNRVILAIDRHDVPFKENQHIPGAYYMDAESIGRYDDYIYSSEVCREVLLSYGINKDTELILYSQETRIACKVAFVACWLGVNQINILDGGIRSWLKKKFSSQEGFSKPQPIDSFGSDLTLRDDVLVATPDDLIVELKTTENVLLASARNWEEYCGLTMGHDWNKGIGEICGSRFADYQSLIDEDQYLIHPSNYLSEWNSWGITKNKTIIFYCGTAWRASLAFFVAKELGFQQVKLFDGSWLKWYEAHKDNPGKYPIQVGDIRQILNL